MRKGFAPILIVVALLSILVIVFFGLRYYAKTHNTWVGENTPILTQDQTLPPQATPTPFDETANWKTYTNVQYRFLIKYPETLIPNVLGNASELFTIPITGNDRIEIETIGLIEPFDLNDEMNNDLQRRGDPKKINFHNKPAVLTKYTVKQAPKPPVIPYMAVFVYLEDKKSKIVLGYYGDESNELLFNQILSTFKFLD